MADDPTPAELMRAIQNLVRVSERMEEKIDKLVTREAFDAEIRRIDERHVNLANRLDAGLAAESRAREAADNHERIAREKDVEEERLSRVAADKENEERSNRARTFALSAIALAATILFGIIGLFTQLGGPPA